MPFFETRTCDTDAGLLKPMFLWVSGSVVAGNLCVRFFSRISWLLSQTKPLSIFFWNGFDSLFNQPPKKLCPCNSMATEGLGSGYCMTPALLVKRHPDTASKAFVLSLGTWEGCSITSLLLDQMFRYLSVFWFCSYSVQACRKQSFCQHLTLVDQSRKWVVWWVKPRRS